MFRYRLILAGFSGQGCTNDWLSSPGNILNLELDEPDMAYFVFSDILRSFCLKSNHFSLLTHFIIIVITNKVDTVITEGFCCIILLYYAFVSSKLKLHCSQFYIKIFRYFIVLQFPKQLKC
ncbi:hypothetical protein XENTR_v10014386 [Xenopus tropicalis]|nr:hypothetical protein XENTR_v10014386 [Xenopus tropicalis]